MAYSKTETAVLALAQPIVEQAGYQVYDCEYCKEGPHYFLRLFIWREQGVALDDCEDVSRELSKLLDEADLIGDNYFLEVSSPGIERVLRQPRHFEEAVGQPVSLKLFQAVNGAREMEGILSAVAEDTLTITTEQQDICIPKKNIAKANVMFQF